MFWEKKKKKEKHVNNFGCIALAGMFWFLKWLRWKWPVGKYWPGTLSVPQVNLAQSRRSQLGCAAAVSGEKDLWNHRAQEEGAR